VFFFVLVRVLAHEGDEPLRAMALGLVCVILAVNALWNVAFFRLRSARLCFLVFLPYDALAVALFACLLRFDPVAAWAMLPYFAYLVYGNLWAYALWRLNRQPRGAGD
jgi:tryptophan-rich sensory protein